MTPNGTDLLKILVDLLAEQNQVKITYEITEKEVRKNDSTDILRNSCNACYCTCCG